MRSLSPLRAGLPPLLLSPAASSWTRVPSAATERGAAEFPAASSSGREARPGELQSPPREPAFFDRAAEPGRAAVAASSALAKAGLKVFFFFSGGEEGLRESF